MKNDKIKHKEDGADHIDCFNKLMPSLDKLAHRDGVVKITLALTKSSVDYFKNEANKREVCYQVMIRNLIDEYVKHCSNQEDN